MSSPLLHLLRQQVRRLAPPRRVEICPPALVQGTAVAVSGWRLGLRDWLSGGWQAPVAADHLHAPTCRPADARFLRVRDEFVQAVQDIRTQQSGMLQGRLRIARSLRDLWHLRPEVFRLVALHFSQAEAQCRLDRLNRHFPTRAPRSGFAPLG